MSALWIRKEYRAASFALLSCVVGVVLMRIMFYFVVLPDGGYGAELLGDALFSLPTQLVFFLAVPFCIYKFYGGRTVKQTLAYSSVGAFRPYYLLALPIGLCVFFLTVGISAVWTALLRATGYTVSSSSAPMPEKFVAGFFIAEAAMTALLPAVCEEFAMRGGLLTTLKRTFGTVGCLVACGVIFGLFHQNVRQVFYTSLFGALAAFLTLRTDSLYPAMLMHFANNFFSVFFDYADEYGWAVGGSFYRVLDAMPGWAFAAAFVLAAAVLAALVAVLLYFNDRRIISQKIRNLDRLKAMREQAISACEAGAPQSAAYPQSGETAIKSETGENSEKGETVPDGVRDRPSERQGMRGRPELSDIAVAISVGVVAVCTTVFTYVWGFLY